MDTSRKSYETPTTQLNHFLQPEVLCVSGQLDTYTEENYDYVW